MKIATWLHGDVRQSGFVEGDRAYPLEAGVTVLDLANAGLASALQRGRETIDAGDGVPLDAVRLLPPLTPPAMRDFVAFEEHVEGVVRSVSGEAGGVAAEWYEAPTFYFTNPHTLRATGEEIAIPGGSQAMDFELEVAAVIGRVSGSDGANLSPAEARQHIFGYTILNDWSARDLQRREMKVNLGPCKGKDFASTLGPWIVTADEFEALHDDEGFLPLVMTVSINGEEFGRDLLSNMGWPFAELVAYAARNSRVLPGDVLGCGTAGGGCLAEAWGRNGAQTPSPLRAGDVVRMEVEGIGAIENRLVEGVTLPPVPRARVRTRARAR
ncbi:fumarylacetoacetate hydrolase family protein [Microbacterium sp. STN6]|uniref:fumarylacetoacetate hydrolase family protein n=1 Tax=Microbacterium sp. STN6 TaxID=2995588 RepID=UPI0022610066|nr:fumarylacetoacetate hydrolase family protein [Microbacterium sp. STN6]MCX7522273.1 fumarylacetoacetate hydrolase family protein [Microbacterium sp. STN6]